MDRRHDGLPQVNLQNHKYLNEFDAVQSASIQALYSFSPLTLLHIPPNQRCTMRAL